MAQFCVFSARNPSTETRCLSQRRPDSRRQSLELKSNARFPEKLTLASLSNVCFRPFPDTSDSDLFRRLGQCQQLTEADNCYAIASAARELPLPQSEQRESGRSHHGRPATTGVRKYRVRVDHRHDNWIRTILEHREQLEISAFGFERTLAQGARLRQWGDGGRSPFARNNSMI